MGLLVHLGGIPLGATARDVTGDVLWATMLSWWVGAIVPRAGLVARSLASYGVCVLVEVSQLWHAPILDAARETRLGHLVLGSGFDARDLLAYALGVAVALLLETAWRVWRLSFETR